MIEKTSGWPSGPVMERRATLVTYFQRLPKTIRICLFGSAMSLMFGEKTQNTFPILINTTKEFSMKQNWHLVISNLKKQCLSLVFGMIMTMD